MEANISENFDFLHSEIKKLLDGEDISGAEVDKKNDDPVERLQKSLEALTLAVSEIEMFSKNETYQEMDPKSLKFLLLPYFLGVLWQRKIKIERKEVWTVAEIYFRDFLERILEAEIITSKPNVLRLLQEASESEEEPLNPQPQSRISSSSDETRKLKIARFKQRKELEGKIKTLTERQKVSDSDDSVVQDLSLNLIRMYAMDAEAELESIVTEKELVKWKMETEGKPFAAAKPKKSELPFETFIITKSDIQKRTFGRGYPSIPVMTVEELYRDRVEKGIWADPNARNLHPEMTAHGDGDRSEDPDVERESLEEEDDEELRARQLAMDEYKDTHRRGWGNRMNRS